MHKFQKYASGPIRRQMLMSASRKMCACFANITNITLCTQNFYTCTTQECSALEKDCKPSVKKTPILSKTKFPHFKFNHNSYTFLKFSPRPHVSGYFRFRNFFFPDTATVHTHPSNSTANPEKNPLSRVEKINPQRIR